MATLGGFFGLLALIVACLGVFGIMAYQVSRRIHELGIRMALGASRGSILTLVLREVALLLAPGCAAGWIAAVVFYSLCQEHVVRRHPDRPSGILAGGLCPGRRHSHGRIPARIASLTHRPHERAAARVG